MVEKEEISRQTVQDISEEAQAYASGEEIEKKKETNKETNENKPEETRKIVENNESISLPLKRKRGRPRKHPLPDPNLPKVPRKRGRKPKPKDPEESKTLSRIKKKPGRPPKKDKATTASSATKATLPPVLKNRKKVVNKKLSETPLGSSLLESLFSSSKAQPGLKKDQESSAAEKKEEKKGLSLPQKERLPSRPSWLKRIWTEERGGEIIAIKRDKSGKNEFFLKGREGGNNSKPEEREYVSKVIQQIKSVYTKRKGVRK